MEAIAIPVKPFGASKSRLAGYLGEDSRRELGLAMLREVLAAIRGWPLCLMVTADPVAAEVGMQMGCILINDETDDLNSAIKVATRSAVERRASSLLVLPSDVPRVTREEIATIFTSTAQVAVVESLDGGTNALLRRPPSAIETSFGPHSAAAHETASSNLSFEKLILPGLSRDVDSIDDILWLAQQPGPSGDVARRISRELEERVP